MFYKYITDITYITESGRKKNRQALTWVSPTCKKGEVRALFWDICASVAIASVYASEIPSRLPGTLTRPLALANPAFGSTCPNSSFSNFLSLTSPFLGCF